MITLDNFQNGVTSVRCWKWFMETGQIITLTSQIHSCPFYYWSCTTNANSLPHLEHTHTHTHTHSLSLSSVTTESYHLCSVQQWLISLLFFFIFLQSNIIYVPIQDLHWMKLAHALIYGLKLACTKLSSTTRPSLVQPILALGWCNWCCCTDLRHVIKSKMV